MSVLTLDSDPKYFENYCRRFGIKPLTFDQEMKLPPNVKRTRGNKISIISHCALIRKSLDDIEYRARMAPEEDDQEHADLVAEYRDAVYEAWEAVEKAWSIGQ